MKSKRFFAVSTFIVIGMLAAGVMWFKKNRTRPPERIILISIDTLRADHLSCYGYRHRTTPVIDAFAESAILFENCFSLIPLTLPAHSSMLTGIIPPTHGVHDNLNMALSDSVLTLPEILQEQGYSTYGIISANVLNNYYGLDQGFDVYDDTFENERGKEMRVPQRFADETATHALKWLEDNQQEKMFMFIHFYDPHDDYEPPPPYDKQFVRPYDGEIAYTDYWVGQILSKLKTLDLYDDALIVIIGDHAELLGEHQEVSHGYYIYHNVLHVPLIIKPAGKASARRVRDNATLIDIAPTLLSQCEIAVPAEMQGVDLSDYFNRDNHTIPDRAIFNQSLYPTKYNGNSLLGIFYNQWHYIQTTRPELYNHETDPGELVNLIAREPKRAHFLQGKLAEILDAAVRADRENPVAMIKTLETLGYVGGSVDADFTFDQEKPDPKDLLDLHHRVQKIMVLSHEEDYEEAIQQCRQVLKEHPDIAEIYRILSVVYMKMESYDQAIDALQQQLALQPENSNALKILSEAYIQNKDYSKAFEIVETILKQDPQDAGAILVLARIHIEQASYDQAIELLQKELALQPDDTYILKFLAEAFFLSEDYPRAKETLHAILKLDPNDTEATLHLANTHIELEAYDQAIELLQQTLALQPDDIDILKPLAHACNKTGDYARAIDYADAVIKQDPNDPEVYYQLGISYHHLDDKDNALANCLKTLELDPNHVKARISAAEIYKLQGRLKEAVEHYKIALIQDPNQPFQQNDVAWIQATQKDPVLYDPPSALLHAQKAVELALDQDSPASNCPLAA